MAEKIGLYFGSSTGATERVSHMIKAEIDGYGVAEVDVHVVAMNKLATMANYRYLIFGCPTWNIGELQDDWALVYPSLGNVSFRGKKVAFFGCGDQFGYSNSFNDSVGILCDKVMDLGGEPWDGFPLIHPTSSNTPKAYPTACSWASLSTRTTSRRRRRSASATGSTGCSRTLA